MTRKCSLCGKNEVEAIVHFKIGGLGFDFVNKTNKCSNCIKGDIIHIMRVKDEQGYHFITLRNRKIQVNWFLYRKLYMDSCNYHALPITRYFFNEMTKVLEQLGVISFKSGWNEQQKRYDNYDSSMMIDWKSIYLNKFIVSGRRPSHLRKTSFCRGIKV